MTGTRLKEFAAHADETWGERWERGEAGSMIGGENEP